MKIVGGIHTQQFLLEKFLVAEDTNSIKAKFI